MVYIYGSSSIVEDYIGENLGPTGPTGNTGPTGPVGPIGSTGNQGTTGNKIVGVTFDNTSVTFRFEDNAALITGSTGFSFAVINVTGPQGGDTAELQLRHVGSATTKQIFTDSYGFTGVFKTFKVKNSASLTGSDNNTINVYGINSGVLGLTGQLLYISNDSGASAEGLDFSKYDKEKNIFLNVSTLYESIDVSNDQFGLPTSTIVNTDTTFDYPRLSTGLTASKSFFAFIDQPNSVDVYPVLNLGVKTGETLPLRHRFRKLSAISEYDSTYDPAALATDYGSCCFCIDVAGGDYSNTCTDYVSKGYCDSIGGNFSANTTCESRVEGANCSFTGACCINGSAFNSNSTYCDRFGGFFIPGIVASEAVCPDRCEVGSCCSEGVCNEISRLECDLIGGVFEEGVSCEFRNCCLEELYKGACCVATETDNGATENICNDDLTPVQCNNIGGVFQGSGSNCSIVNCCVTNEDGGGGDGPTPGGPGDEGGGAGFIVERLINESSECLLTTNPTENFQPGDEFAGGILLGIVGEPNDYGSIFAKGQSPYCLMYGYSSISQCEACQLVDQTNPIRYVLTAGYNSTSENNGPGFCDSVMPYRVFPESCFSELTRNSKNYATNREDLCYNLPHTPYLYNLYELPIKRHTASTEQQEIVSKYYDVAEKYYGTSTITKKWALVIAPEDLSYNEDSDLSWGIRQSTYGKDEADPMEDGKYFGSPFFDGLIGTRLFDKSSITWKPWFNPDFDNSDEDAYQRWVHSNLNPWPSDTDQNLVETDETYFEEKFSELWESENKENSIMRLISEWNDENKFGYSDWYVPSIIELMYIYGNLDVINLGLLRAGFKPIAHSKYWSSTTGSKFEATNKNVCEANRFVSTENRDTSLEPENSKFASHAHRAFIQSFVSGLIESGFRNDNMASARPVRRIPLYETTFNCELNNHLARYIESGNGDCYNLLTCNCPELN